MPLSVPYMKSSGMMNRERIQDPSLPAKKPTLEILSHVLCGRKLAVFSARDHECLQVDLGLQRSIPSLQLRIKVNSRIKIPRLLEHRNI